MDDRSEPQDVPILDGAHHFASDVDGVLHLVIDEPYLDCSTWTVRSAGGFSQTTLWGEPSNFLGYGDPRTSWVTQVDRGETTMVEIDGVRHALRNRRS